MSKIKISDYIVHFLEEKGIEHIFGYPGGMLTHFMDSLAKSSRIQTHLTYHEQGAAFAACGYGQIMQTPTVAFATSGPGATNLLTGICNAWFDSIPVIFITGQVNTYEGRNGLPLKQKGFQETDIVSIVRSVTKHAVYIENGSELVAELSLAYTIACTGRPGPVLLDIPMNVFREMIENETKKTQQQTAFKTAIPKAFRNNVIQSIIIAKRPCILLGNGAHCIDQKRLIQLVNKLQIPVVTSMPAVDLLPAEESLHYGFIGAYGGRVANTIAEKCDLLLTIGTRLDERQTGTNREWFATKAKLIRFDIDETEFSTKVKPDELQIVCSVAEAVSLLEEIPALKGRDSWLLTCNLIRERLSSLDTQTPNEIVAHLSKHIPREAVITTDVGQNQVWVAQSYHVQPEQRILFSAGLGAMGYSLPAAIGACLASGKTAVCFCGDGGLQMNIQELQTISTQHLSVKIIVLNNRSLGMIRHFQEMYFDSNYFMTIEGKGYQAPNFIAIAEAYGIKAMQYFGEKDDDKLDKLIKTNAPALIEVVLDTTTYTRPKSVYNLPLSCQEPRLPQALQDAIDAL